MHEFSDTGEEQLYAKFTEADAADIEKRTVLYEQLAADYGCDVGKVGVISFPNFSMIYYSSGIFIYPVSDLFFCVNSLLAGLNVTNAASKTST